MMESGARYKVPFRIPSGSDHSMIWRRGGGVLSGQFRRGTNGGCWPFPGGSVVVLVVGWDTTFLAKRVWVQMAGVGLFRAEL
jgi:hypothetical protein